MPHLPPDLRFALRALARRPLFTAVALLTLGLGIGGTTAMFSVVDGVLVRELPYRDPETLVSVWKAWPAWRGVDGLDYVWDHIQLPWEDYLEVRAGAPALAEVAAFQNDEKVLYGRGVPTRLSVGMASANLFPMLGVRPVLGRVFADDEVPPGGEPARVALLGHELWEGRFGASPDVVGSTLVLDRETYQVVGVLPERFRLGSDLLTVHDNGGAPDAGLRDLWLPLGTGGVDCGNCYEVIGRLAPGRTAAEARDEVQPLLVARPVPGEQIARVASRKEVVTRGFGTPLVMLLGAAGLLLLIACTNVAGLLLGEAPGRRREIAVRAALGAPRGRIVRQLLTESALLGVMGALLGLLLAWAGTEALLAVAPPLPRLEEVGPSLRVLLFAAAAGLATGVVFGLVPALSLARGAATASLRPRGGTGDGRPLRVMVALQVGLTVVLLIGGGLFGRSLLRVMDVDPGFDPGRLATMAVPLPPGRPTGVPEEAAFYERIVAAVEAVPGVESASVVNALPFPGGRASQSFGYERGGQELNSTQWARWALPSYLATLGVPLVRGRLLGEDDAGGAPGAMLVSESLAARNWPGESPLGKRVRWDGRDWSVVGVVGDVRQRALGAPVEPTFYVSIRQRRAGSLELVARTAGDPAALLPALQRAVWSVDPEVPIARPAPMTDLVRASEADERFRALLMWTFAALATGLASVGVFGVTARAVGARSRELGIRTALGAEGSALVRLVIRDGLSSALVGTACGLVLAWAGAGVVAHLLYGIDGRDPSTYAGAALLAVAACLLAAWLPARRVMAISPMEAISRE